nr:secretory phospholipase A2 receptor-like [Cherax quadricarinatus]
MDWTQARSYCFTMAADLAAPITFQAMQKYLSLHNNTNIWVGVRYRMWVHGNQGIYDGWVNNTAPTSSEMGLCGLLQPFDGVHYLVENDCYQPNIFLCQNLYA